jgi:hypothetical protein
LQTLKIPHYNPTKKVEQLTQQSLNETAKKRKEIKTFSPQQKMEEKNHKKK